MSGTLAFSGRINTPAVPGLQHQTPPANIERNHRSVEEHFPSAYHAVQPATTPERRGYGDDMATRSTSFTAALAAAAVGSWCSSPALGDAPARNDYPTYARVQFVQDCAARAGGSQADVYKCSCVIDKLAEQLTYDQYVEDSTFAHYSTLPGEGGGIFRDPKMAKDDAKRYRALEAEAYRSCGLKSPQTR